MNINELQAASTGGGGSTDDSTDDSGSTPTASVGELRVAAADSEKYKNENYSRAGSTVDFLADSDGVQAVANDGNASSGPDTGSMEGLVSTGTDDYGGVGTKVDPDGNTEVTNVGYTSSDSSDDSGNSDPDPTKNNDGGSSPVPDSAGDAADQVRTMVMPSSGDSSSGFLSGLPGSPMMIVGAVVAIAFAIVAGGSN